MAAYRWWAAVVVFAASCASHASDAIVRCTDEGTPAASCLVLQACPDVAASFYTCGGFIPARFGHDMIWVADGPATDGTTSKPVGCIVTLPYEDPAFPGHAVQCTCVNEGPVAENHANWHCAAV